MDELLLSRLLAIGSMQPLSSYQSRHLVTLSLDFLALEMRRMSSLSRLGEATSAQTNLTYFKRVGIQSQECDEEPMIPDDMDHGCHQIPDCQLQHDEAFSHLSIV